MSAFDPAVLEAVRREREVELTTWGRKSGKPSRRIIWVFPDGDLIFIRSGLGFTRDWPRNLRANGKAILHAGGHDVAVSARLVEDPALARHVTNVAFAKYQSDNLRPAAEDQAPTPGEFATFELFPDDGA